MWRKLGAASRIDLDNQSEGVAIRKSTDEAGEDAFESRVRGESLKW